MVTTASHRSWIGTLSKSLETLLAPNTLWIAANLAAPCSDEKYGANIQSDAHFLLRNLHAPHGEPVPAVVPLPEDAIGETNKNKSDDFYVICTKRKKGSLLFLFFFFYVLFFLLIGYFREMLKKIERSDDFRIGIVGDVHERTRNWWWRKNEKEMKWWWRSAWCLWVDFIKGTLWWKRIVLFIYVHSMIIYNHIWYDTFFN